jgi:hypothetical protein
MASAEHSHAKRSLMENRWPRSAALMQSADLFAHVQVVNTTKSVSNAVDEPAVVPPTPLPEVVRINQNLRDHFLAWRDYCFHRTEQGKLIVAPHRQQMQMRLRIGEALYRDRSRRRALQIWREAIARNRPVHEMTQVASNFSRLSALDRAVRQWRRFSLCSATHKLDRKCADAMHAPYAMLRALNQWRDSLAARLLSYRRAIRQIDQNRVRRLLTEWRLRWIEECQSKWLVMRLLFQRWRRRMPANIMINSDSEHDSSELHVRSKRVIISSAANLIFPWYRNFSW